MIMAKQEPFSRYSRIVLSWVLILFGLYLTSLYSYLLFHSTAEIFSIVVACGVFMVAWNSRRFLDNNYLLFIGIAYLFVAVLDLIHTLAYTGMGVFPSYTTNLPTQLWIAARYVESLSLLIAPLILKRRLRTSLVFVGFAAASVLLLCSIFFWNVFPDCFIEGTGLTPFKKISEYTICFILLVSIGLLIQRREAFDKGVLRLLVGSLLLTIGSELFFTFYVHAYGLSNLIGHFFKIISFYLIYRAIIQTGLVRPYDLLFRNLKESEKKYRDLVENMNEVMVSLKSDGVLTYTSPAIESLIGRLPSEVIGQHFSEFLFSKDLPRLEESFRRILTGDRAANDYRVLTKSGEIRWMHTSSRPIYDGDLIIGVHSLLSDITDRKRAEEALEKARDELEQRVLERTSELAEANRQLALEIEEHRRMLFWRPILE